ncbi:MAG TPA: OmpA family protein, partial [Saprospiraceae bacterium]|nr:OmpA family protein [Saprospiraceae bacterium]
NCQLYQAFFKNGQWNLPEKIGFCQPNAHYVQPSLNQDATLLYFSSNSEEGWGGFDIYRSERADDGSWSSPQLMSRAINTPGNEKFPYIEQDTLFFASDHHTGYGGLDLFRSYRITAGRWSQAMNLRKPINSGYDDFAYVKVHGQAYLSSNRDGNDNIYQIRPNPEPRDTTKEIPELALPNIYFEVFVRDASQQGKQIRTGTEQLLSNVDIQLSKSDSILEPLEESTPRIPVYQLFPGKAYSLRVSKEGYFKQEMVVSTKGIQLVRGAADLYLERIVYLQPIEIDKEIILEDIYYDFDKWNIREDAKPSLLRLKKIMQDNPELAIQLSSHTDCRGTDAYNLELSQKRAQSARQFLITKGIEPNRITAVGYGESRLLTNCKCERCSEDEHQLNRRTTFKVVE